MVGTKTMKESQKMGLLGYRFQSADRPLPSAIVLWQHLELANLHESYFFRTSPGRSPEYKD